MTSIAAPAGDGPDILLSSSRDKSVILWSLTREDAGPTGAYGYPRRALRGHSHFVQDVVLSSDGQARATAAAAPGLTTLGFPRRRRLLRRARAPPAPRASLTPRCAPPRPAAASSRCPARGTARCACGT